MKIIEVQIGHCNSHRRIIIVHDTISWCPPYIKIYCMVIKKTAVGRTKP